MTSTVFTLTLVRHGQTIHNKLKIIQGQMETQLTDLGREQAKTLCKYLERTGEKFNQVFSSDLIRAYETCQIVCNGQYDIVKSKLLRERSFGELEGSSLDKLKEEAYRAGHDETNFTQFRPKGGETMDEVMDRIHTFCCTELFPTVKQSQSILIVTHGGVIREFLKLFRQFRCNISNKDLIITPNTGINRFQVEFDGQYQFKQVSVTYLHQIPHLPQPHRYAALTEEQLNDANKKKEVEYAI